MGLRIGILGAGNVGGALGGVWAAKGHEIVFGVPDPRGKRVAGALAALQGKGRATSNAEATSVAEVVVLSVPWSAARQAVETAGNLTGKVLVDCTNPLSRDLKGLEVGLTTSGAEQVAAWAPAARVVKAFNTIGAVNFGNAAFGDSVADGFYCGDDDTAKNLVKPLIEDAGFHPVDVGPLRNARLLEPLALLWIDLAVNQKQGADHAFKLLRR
jgi:8-hydroxy-5-deazaflavin:NADPH oxidoreductase